MVVGRKAGGRVGVHSGEGMPQERGQGRLRAQLQQEDGRHAEAAGVADGRSLSTEPSIVLRLSLEGQRVRASSVCELPACAWFQCVRGTSVCEVPACAWFQCV